MKKRSLLLVLLALSAALLLTSCGGKDAASDENTLTVMGKRTDLEKSYMTSIFQQYEQATGNELEIIG